MPKRTEALALQRLFDCCLRAVEEAEARLADMDRRVLESADQPARKGLVSRRR